MREGGGKWEGEGGEGGEGGGGKEEEKEEEREEGWKERKGRERGEGRRREIKLLGSWMVEWKK